MDYTAHTVTALDVESAGVDSWFDSSTGALYGSYFGIEFSGNFTSELAAALTEANKNGAKWSRFSIGRALPRRDRNAEHMHFYGIRLY